MRSLYVILVCILALFVSGCRSEHHEAKAEFRGSTQWNNFHWAHTPVVITVNIESISLDWQAAMYDAADVWNDEVQGTAKFVFVDDDDAAIIVTDRDEGDNDIGGVTQLYTTTYGEIGYGDMNLNDHYAEDGWDYRQAVACHELGHVLGLNHSVGVQSCMTSTVQYLFPGETDLQVLDKMYR